MGAGQEVESGKGLEVVWRCWEDRTWWTGGRRSSTGTFRSGQRPWAWRAPPVEGACRPWVCFREVGVQSGKLACSRQAPWSVQAPGQGDKLPWPRGGQGPSGWGSCGPGGSHQPGFPTVPSAHWERFPIPQQQVQNRVLRVHPPAGSVASAGGCCEALTKRGDLDTGSSG